MLLYLDANNNNKSKARHQANVKRKRRLNCVHRGLVLRRVRALEAPDDVYVALRRDGLRKVREEAWKGRRDGLQKIYNFNLPQFR